MGDHQPALQTAASAASAASTARPRGLRDRRVLALLVLVVALQGLSWGLLEGYQLADSVEYMERARAFIRTEEVIDSRQIRSFGFSALLLPIFGAAELFGIRDYRCVVWIVRCLQMALGLWLVLSCVRIGHRLGGRNAGLASGFLVGVNPIFLQYSVAPLADIAAALCVALAVEHLSTPTDRRGGLRAGLWLGLGLLMAYKTLPIAAVLLALVAVRDRRRGLPSLWGATLGYASGVGAQVVLDRVVYGRWGSSLFNYFGENAVSIVARLLYRVGLVPQGKGLYDWWYDLEGGTSAVGDTLRQLQPADWYWTHLSELLVWPVVAIAALALVRCFQQRNWRSSLLLGTLAVNVLLLSQKGSKDFRLWLPLLPLLGPLLGWGWAWIADARAGSTRPAWRTGLAFGLLALAAVLGGHSLTRRNSHLYADYWRAVEYVAQRAAQERAANPGAPPARIAAAYHWAVFLHTSADLQLTKLPRQVTGWAGFAEQDRFRVFDTLRTQDWFLVHGPVLTDPGHRELTYRINAWFDVEEVFWDREAAEDLGPIYVMRRRESDELDPQRRALFEVQPDGDPELLRQQLGFEEPVRLV
ncbi:MAG: glycosyltransferase family 39 protein, partial [Planctomycetota bacterium]